MKWRVIALSLILVTALAAASNAQSVDYSHTAKLVLKLEKMPDMPSNPATGLVPTTFGTPVQSDSGADFAETADYADFAAPAMPTPIPVQASTELQVIVLYSSDPSIKVNDTDMLILTYDSQDMPGGLQDQLLNDLNPGTIVGVNSYTLDGSDITVDVSTPMWQDNIFIVNGTSSSATDTQDPFRINLNMFESFPAFTPFSTQSVGPSDMSPVLPSLNTSIQVPDVFNGFTMYNQPGGMFG
jgi:hypothetical protein